MNLNDTFARLPLFPRGAWAPAALQVRRDSFRHSTERLCAFRNSRMATWLSNGFFCVSLWISLLIAIWLCRGWVGLFFSGQILSAATYVFQRLARKTQNAFSLSKGARQEFQEAR